MTTINLSRWDGDFSEAIIPCLQIIREAAGIIGQKAHQIPGNDHPGTSVARLFTSGDATWTSIQQLLFSPPNALDQQRLHPDIATLLRRLHEICLQAEYIITGDRDRSISSEILSRRFVEFQHIEKEYLAKQICNSPGEIAQSIARSQRRDEGEAELKARADAVRGDYRNKARSWYHFKHDGGEGPENLKEIAELVGAGSEYHWYATMNNAYTHASPYALENWTIFPSSDILFFACSRLVCRLLTAARRACGAKESSYEAKVFEQLNKVNQPVYC